MQLSKTVSQRRYTERTLLRYSIQPEMIHQIAFV